MTSMNDESQRKGERGQAGGEGAGEERTRQNDMKDDGSIFELVRNFSGTSQNSVLTLKLAHPLVPTMGVGGTDYVTANYRADSLFPRDLHVDTPACILHFSRSLFLKI